MARDIFGGILSGGAISRTLFDPDFQSGAFAGLGGNHNDTDFGDSLPGGLGSTDTVHQGAQKPDETSNGTIVTSAYLENQGTPEEAKLETGLDQMIWERTIKPPRPISTLEGPLSGRGQAKSVSRLNLYCKSEEGGGRYDTRDALVGGPLQEWRFLGFQEDGLPSLKGVRVIRFAYKSKTQCIWPKARENDSLYIIVAKQARDGGRLPSLSSIHGVGALPAAPPPPGPPAAAMPMNPADIFARARVVGAIKNHFGASETDISRKEWSDTYSLKKRRLPAEIAAREHWVFIPIACPRGQTPDRALYQNDDFNGECIPIGRLDHYMTGRPTGTASEDARRKSAVFPTGSGGDFLKDLLDLPTIEVYTRIK